MLKYYQNSLNSCCFSSLASSFASIKQAKDDNDLYMRKEESLKSEVVNHIYFSNAILKRKELKSNKKCIIV